MATQEKWINNQIILTTWKKHLTPEDLNKCFGILSRAVHETGHTVHILFDISSVERIPSQAPILFIRANIAAAPNLGRIAVIGINPFAQILAQIAVKMTTHDIKFFATEGEAMAYLGATHFVSERVINEYQGY